MARYRFTVTYEVDGGSFDTWDDDFEVTSGSDTFGSWDAYTGVLNVGDEIQFLNSTSRETDLRSLSGFTNNSNIIASSTYIGYATVRTIASGASTVQWTMHPTDHPATPKSKVYSVTSTATGSTIPLGITSGAIDMNTLRDFFGDPTYGSNTVSLTNLYRGGDLVPDISSNSSIPTSGSISLDDFYGCATVLKFDKQPSDLYIFEAGVEQTGTAQAQWVQTIAPSTQGTFDVGYGALKNAPNMEYRIILTGANQLTRIVFTGNNYTSSTSSYTSPWLVGYGTVQLERDWYAANNSFDISGTIQFQVRLIYNGTTYSETSSTATWRLQKINSIE